MGAIEKPHRLFQTAPLNNGVMTIMNERLEDKPIVRDIEICRKCKWFRIVDSDDGYDKSGIYRGKGVFCRNYFSKYTTWRKGSNTAVSEEEFVRVVKSVCVYENECLQVIK